MIHQGDVVWVEDLALNGRRITGTVTSVVGDFYEVLSGRHAVDSRRVTRVFPGECAVAKDGWLVEARTTDVEELLP